MSQPHEQFSVSLRRAGYSLTDTRMTVFQALLQEEPQTMQALVRRCSTIDRASVYRTITLFEQLGIVQRLQQGWKYTLELSDAFNGHHHHATCLQCGALLALPENKTIERELHEIALMHGFTVQRHQLELQGVCKACTYSNASIAGK